MDNKAITKEIHKTKTSVNEIAHTDSELYKVGMYTTAAFAAMVGLWGLVCLSSAVLSSGGPVTLLKNLFHAVTGI